MGKKKKAVVLLGISVIAYKVWRARQKDQGDVLTEDVVNAFADIYKRPRPFKKTPKYYLRKFLNDRIQWPLRRASINLKCFLIGHDWELMFKPDPRPNRETLIMFNCGRCLRMATYERKVIPKRGRISETGFPHSGKGSGEGKQTQPESVPTAEGSNSPDRGEQSQD